MNNQLGKLSGLNDKELKDYKTLFNDMDLEVSEEDQSESVWK